MNAKHNFDFVMDGQEMFRILLDALSNPGRIKSYAAYAGGFAFAGEWLALATVLLDGEVSYYSNLAPGIKEEIHFLTGCREENAEAADFLLLAETAQPESIFAKIKMGTLTDPHDSATLLIRCQDAPADQELLLSGPGIPREGRRLLLSRPEKAWLDERDKQQYEFPCGVDLLFLRPDQTLVAVTRKVVA